MDNNNKISSLQADLILIIVAFIWGSGFVVTKNTLDSMSPLYIMFFRFSIAAIIASVIFRKHLKSTSKSDIKAGLYMGIVLSIAFAFQTFGLQYTTVGKQAFLTGTNVVIVPFIYWLISKRKPAINNLTAAILTFIGIGMLTLDFKNDIFMNTGDVYTLICAVFFAGHIAITGFFAQDKNPFVINTLQLIFSAVFFLIAAILIDGVTLNFSQGGLLGVSYLGIFSTMICFSLQTFAQKYTLSTHAAIILSLESVFGSILGVLLLSEVFTPIMVVGCLIIFIGIITAETDWKFLKK